MKNLYLFQVQDRTDFGDYAQYWLPYSAGCLWAYAQQFANVTDNWSLRDIFFRREPVQVVMSRMHEPAVCAFSVYVWNREYSLEAARQIKQTWPECVIVFGGPEVSADWLRYAFADCLVLGEGELSFVQILDTVAQGRRPEVIVKNQRMQTLDEVPSPYLSGVFDDIISRNPTVFWNATCETNRGCPYACTFCDWGGLTQSKIKKFQLERVAAEIEWMSQRAIKSVFIADSNFGIFRERDMEIAKLFRAWLDRDTGLEYISTNYAKNSNAVVFEIAKILGAVNKGITFSVQSMNPDTLKVIKRQNMDTNDTREMLSLARAHGVHFYTELMLPLPLETLETWKAGVCELLELGQHHRIELNTVAILENTEMNSVQRDKYRMQTIQVKGLQGLAVEESGIDEYVNIVKSTNTMTTSDVIEAYLYTWMVSNLHMNNYTQILSKYHRYVNHIPYREFYDRVFADLSQGGDSVVHRHFDRVRTALENLYSVGDTGIQDLYLGVLMSDATLDFYHNITDVLDFSKRLALSLGDVDPGVMQIQERALFNEIYTVPFQVRTEHDIDTWQPGPCVYDINSAGSAVDINYKNFYATLRRDKSKIFNVICRRS